MAKDINFIFIFSICTEVQKILLSETLDIIGLEFYENFVW